MDRNTLITALESAWTRWPDRTALVFGDLRMTYAQLAEEIIKLASAYRQIGISPGDRIVCHLSNRPEQIISMSAAWMCSAVHVGVDHQLTGAELSSLVGLVGASILLHEPRDEDTDESLSLPEVRRNNPDTRIIFAGDHRIPDGQLSLSELIDSAVRGKSSEQFPQAVPSAQDPAVIFITSGTTGKPKAPVGFHGNLSRRWQMLAKRLRFGPEDVHLAHLPLSHGFGLMMAMAGLMNGGRLVLLKRFSRERVFQLLETEQVTVLNGSAAHFNLILSELRARRHSLRSLRLGIGSAAFFSPSMLRVIISDWGLEFMLMYGSSEGVGVITTDPDDMLRGSVGRPAADAVAIVGSDHTPLPIGEVGEIAFSRQVFPVQYWGESGQLSPSAKEAGDVKGDVWYYSGDRGHLDNEGRLYILGRLKHQINRGGMKVDPAEVEGALLLCPNVSDAAVIGMPHSVLGEIVCACVVPAPDEAISLERLRAGLKDVLAPFKLPEQLRVLEYIPRTPVGKVDLEKLRSQVMSATSQAVTQT